jgi:hypothetical protein
VKKTRRDQSPGDVIHMCMETTQGNSLCSHLYLKLAKTLFLILVLWFFFYKIRAQEGRTRWGGGWGLTSVGGGGGREERGRRMKVVQTMYVNAD